MASFAHLAHFLDVAADIMLGDHTLNPWEALARSVWGGPPFRKKHGGADYETWYIASRIVEIHHWHTSDDQSVTHISDIPRDQARRATRHMAELFHRIDFGPDHPRVEGDDLDQVARLMWERAHGVELAACR